MMGDLHDRHLVEDLGVSSALRSMVRTARFEIVEEYAPREPPQLLDMLLRPVDAGPVLPAAHRVQEV